MQKRTIGSAYGLLVAEGLVLVRFLSLRRIPMGIAIGFIIFRCDAQVWVGLQVLQGLSCLPECFRLCGLGGQVFFFLLALLFFFICLFQGPSLLLYLIIL